MKFIAMGCQNAVDVHSYREDRYIEATNGASVYNSEEYRSKEYYVGSIPPLDSDDDEEERFAVFPARVFQTFKLSTKLHNGKSYGMFYQVPDSTAHISAGVRTKAKIKLPLDTHRLVCPT